MKLSLITGGSRELGKVLVAQYARHKIYVRPPKKEPYGMAAVFEDLYDHLLDLLELNADEPIFNRVDI
jgi:NAD(P)-dependent dehydrogenase (short-subunit alcohol dehydrogenase family)